MTTPHGLLDGFLAPFHALQLRSRSPSPSGRRIPPSLSMKKCFAIDEVLQEILDHVYDDGDGCGSLVSLALTAKAFKEPALNRLWSSLCSLDPFYHVIAANMPAGQSGNVDAFLNSGLLVCSGMSNIQGQVLTYSYIAAILFKGILYTL
jgi:hypothetical protein